MRCDGPFCRTIATLPDIRLFQFLFWNSCVTSSGFYQNNRSGMRRALEYFGSSAKVTSIIGISAYRHVVHLYFSTLRPFSRAWDCPNLDVRIHSFKLLTKPSCTAGYQMTKRKTRNANPKCKPETWNQWPIGPEQDNTKKNSKTNFAILRTL